ncbi:MAG: hypothetical protein QM571_02715 [Micrococcaceae bacterium]
MIVVKSFSDEPFFAPFLLMTLLSFACMFMLLLSVEVPAVNKNDMALRPYFSAPNKVWLVFSTLLLVASVVCVLVVYMKCQVH